MIGNMVSDVLAETERRVREAGVETIEDVRGAGRALAGFSARLPPKSASSSASCTQRLYGLPSCRPCATRPSGSSPISPPPIAPIRRCCPAWWQREEIELERLRTIGDFIAGMTDRFAIARHEELVGPVKLPASRF